MNVTSQKDLYKLLGVKEDATADEIKRAYRDLAKTHHPDRTGGDKAKEARFKDITAAHEILSDPKKRAQYDEIRRGGPFVGAQGQPFDFGGFGGGRGAAGLDDLFSQIFGGAGGARGAPGGGRTRVVFTHGFGDELPFEEPRPRRRARRAPAEPAETQVRTPDGHVLTRRGDDLYHDLDVSIDEAALGAKVPVPTPDGTVTLTIPPATSSGKKLRLRGKGAVRPDGTRGDEYAVVRIVLPESIDERGRELIREFARRNPVKIRR
jgi:curved DNA-binding protein